MLDNIDWSLAPDLRRLIVPLVQGILEATNLQHDYEILRRRYGFDGCNAYTLQEVGSFFNLSRERIRQREERALTTIRQVLFGEGGKTSDLVPQEIIQETVSLRQVLQSADKVLNETEIANLLEARYETEVGTQPNSIVGLLMAILDFEQLAQHVSGCGVVLIPSWTTTDSLNRKTLYHAVQVVRVPLYSRVKPISLFDLMIEINRKKQKRLDKSYIRWALKIRPDVEMIGQETFQVRFVYLSSLADKAYRVLWEAEEPKHVRYIWGEISHVLARTGSPQKIPWRSVQQQLVQDNRFRPVGRGGDWKLAEWTHFTGDTIVDLAQEFFHFSKSPATGSAVYDYVHSKRKDATRQSVLTYLASRKDLFIKTANGKYALTAWGDQLVATANPTNPALRQVSLATRDVLSGRHEMLLSELIRELSKRTPFADSTLYRIIRELIIIGVIEKTNDSRVKTVRYNDNVKLPDPAGSKPPSPPIIHLRISVQAEIVDFLRQQPMHKWPMQRVGDHVVSKLKCARTTFYRYLSEMPNIAKVSEAGVLFCYLLDVGNVPLYPQVDQIEDKQLSDNLRRCIGLLKLDTIDIGLAQLGKIFEITLKEFLQEAQTQAKYAVGKKDLDRLVDMIDCVERNGIIQDKRHLTFLRGERNERVHGAIPDIKEREALMQVSSSLAGLFIDYIIFFYRQRKQLGP